MRLALLIFLLLNACSAVAGDWIFRPTVNGTLRISQQGGSAEMGPDTLTQHQQAGETLSLQVIPVGQGRCEGGLLVGNGPLSVVKLSLTPVLRSVVQTGQQIACGESVQFDAPDALQLVGVKAQTSSVAAGSLKGLPADIANQRILLGNINFISSGKTVASSAIYLDLTSLGDEAATLKASFNKSALLFGEVTSMKDAQGTATLTISKAQQVCGCETAIPYVLKFESIQQRDNSFRLVSAQGDVYVPYRVSIGDRNMSPSDSYNGTVPAGSGTVDILNINFTLAAQQTYGLAAGTKLTDTLTAVITPDS